MYRTEVRMLKNPLIHMKLNLKESQKYVKQGRTYTSTIQWVETLMWFVYEKDLNNVHKRLGIFASCERETLRVAQEMAKTLDGFRTFTKELQKTKLSEEKAEVLKEMAKAGEKALHGSYEYWDTRMKLDEKARTFLFDVADDRAGLRDACEKLEIKKLLHALLADYKDIAETMDGAMRKLESMGQNFMSDREYQHRAASMINNFHEDFSGYDKEGALFAALKECASRTRDDGEKAAGILQKALTRYERAEKQASGRKKEQPVQKKENTRENKPSVRKKMEAMRTQQPENRGKVAEKNDRDMIL